MIAKELERLEQQFANAKKNYEDLSKEQSLLERKIGLTKKNLHIIAKRLVDLQNKITTLAKSQTQHQDILIQEKEALANVAKDMGAGLIAMENQLQITGGKYIEARHKYNELSHKVARDKLVLVQQNKMHTK